MPYALKFYLYFGVWIIVAVVVADQWLRGFNAALVLSFGAAYGIGIILFGRWLFGRKTL